MASPNVQKLLDSTLTDLAENDLHGLSDEELAELGKADKRKGMTELVKAEAVRRGEAAAAAEAENDQPPADNPPADEPDPEAGVGDDVGKDESERADDQPPPDEQPPPEDESQPLNSEIDSGPVPQFDVVGEDGRRVVRDLTYKAAEEERDRIRAKTGEDLSVEPAEAH